FFKLKRQCIARERVCRVLSNKFFQHLSASLHQQTLIGILRSLRIGFCRSTGRLGHACGFFRSGCGQCALASRVSLTDTRSLAAQLAQVVKLRAAHASAPYNVYAVNDARVKREDALDSDTET